MAWGFIVWEISNNSINLFLGEGLFQPIQVVRDKNGGEIKIR
jgi:hypothetical protein